MDKLIFCWIILLSIRKIKPKIVIIVISQGIATFLLGTLIFPSTGKGTKTLKLKETLQIRN